MKNTLNRRGFIHQAGVIGSGFALLGGYPLLAIAKREGGKPALLGGAKAVQSGFSRWPIYDKTEENAIVAVLKSNKWGRLQGAVTANFETAYANLLGVGHSLGVSSGTAALTTILGALDVGPEDEVIMPIYTFIATYNVIVLNYALPIFVDTDVETFQIDANKVEGAVTSNTKAIMPVHIGGSPANIDRFLEIGDKTNLPIIEDACQAHLAEWRGKKVGSFGLAGAFSFQSSKNLNCAEGGAVTTNDESFAKRCYNFHNQGQGGRGTSYGTGVGTRGSNLRLTEFQSGLLLAQMTRLEEQSRLRHENAKYLTSLLEEIPGIEPAKLYEGTDRSAYHLYMFRYLKEHFDGLSRAQFLKALAAEGIPCSSGYTSMNKGDYVKSLATNRHYIKIYGKKKMHNWLEQNQFPQNDIIAEEQGVWFVQTVLLSSRKHMEQIAEAIMKIKKYANELKAV
ncbi:DegT/DnrJ/EryC1/StrS family aminotransferase [Parapedobacter sp. 10938]|uniref:DegT/DnrJ/EryC1/StrS family aminotransferase n=1 Tax=Parapedobacter flavus TaxID=3110225 RepID=UPI002DB604DD|nr:DegT/DnrJ/EryC1/StrS family aminotransferase [Parapedobacter sp. 10938]MEC3878300.1 DegT/DnrJ/EryC1/StrS family aminotransferase [Parapedobacter sp. 10938]